jgi:soluble lytic murein transglycosylase
MIPIESMHLFLFLFLFMSTIVSASQKKPGMTELWNSEKLQLSKSDHIIAENLVNMLQFTDKGYINKEILSKVLRDTHKSKVFFNFLPWLKEIQEISRLSDTPALLIYCRKYIENNQTLPIERLLKKRAGNYCRERALESIGRDIEKTQNISEDSSLFIQQNLKFYLTKKNKKNFAFFLQSQLTRPEILKKISHEVTSYSVRNEIVPSQEVLKDIVINEQITRLIQDKGFNPLQHQNVFYAEYGKLIEQSYKLLEARPSEDKVTEQFNFLKNYLELNQDHLPLGLCLTRMNDFAKSTFRNGYKNLSRNIFKFIIKKNNKEVIEDALFFYLWTHLFHNEYKDAQKIANQFGLIKNSKSIVDSRLKFWIGVIHEELDDTSDAITIYEDIILNNPLSFYGIMSNKKLQKLKPDSHAVPFYSSNSLPETNPAVLNLKDFDEDHLSSLLRLKAWASINSNKLIKLELKRLNNHSLPIILSKNPVIQQLSLKSDLHLLHSKIIQGSHNYLATFRYLYSVLEKKEVIFNRQLLEILYPRPYLDTLTRTLKGKDLDPIVVLSLIRQESVFNTMARSPVGARGLMQLMPTTAKRFRHSVKEHQLHAPVLNIEIGIKYFNNLMKRYDGNLVYVLSAYNAGESRVEKWKNLYFDTDETILKNIEAIPFLETRNYVKLIFRNIYFYKLLIEKKEPVIDPREANKIFDIYLGFNK